jgi:hypothetical protein
MSLPSRFVVVAAAAVLGGGVRPLYGQGPSPAVPADEVVARLAEGTADPRADVRSVAARVAFTTRHKGLEPALLVALASEQNPVAGAEIVRALTLIRGAEADAVIREALPRFDHRATAAWVETMGRARPADVWRHVDAMPDNWVVGRVLVGAARAEPDAAIKAFAALRTSPALVPAYEAMIHGVPYETDLLAWPLYAAGLETSALRSSVVLSLLRRQAAKGVMPQEATAALAAVIGAPPPADLAWVPVFLEIVRRDQDPTTRPRPLAETIASLDRATFPEPLLGDWRFEHLDGKETAAFRKLAGPQWKKPELPSRPSQPPKDVPMAAKVEPPGPAGARTRMLRPLSSSLVRDLERLLHCAAIPGQVARLDAGVSITSSSDSDPSRLTASERRPARKRRRSAPVAA